MSDLHAAAYDADLKTVQALLASGAKPDERDDRGFTPLLWSCLRGAVGQQGPVVAALLSAGADPDAITAAGDSSCLIWAVQVDAQDLIEVLLECGANVNGVADGVTPLMVAARDGNAEVVTRLLQKGADPSIACGSFQAADYARHGGHDDVANLLDRAGAA
ncbi:ankyrin repeat domain-containing protein [Brevundimonas sp. UBA7664]|uniref:ankyrin repeat domain-containing protein n=1 Tax=Brevundimonas sp. UBA7664 TaxID=1946141 RepID=UPI0025C4A7D3|nr:ankyrin repeat domain-containing protein [Brevundimonas sp. UBA7664]